MRKGRLFLFGTFVLLALLVAGCGGDDTGPLLEDRFGNPSSGWGSDSQELFDRGYQDGSYFFDLYEPDWFVWAHPGRTFTDVAIDVEARQVSGSPDGHYGILCRYRRPNTFYYFAITGDGYYAIIRAKNGTQEVLTGEGFAPSPILQNTSGTTQRIRAVCAGPKLSLYVNGEAIATVTDDALRKGDVGLGVGSGPSGAIRVHFDNVGVVVPGEGEKREE